MSGMKQRTNQSGFGTLAIVLVLAVVAVLAVSGIVVYQHHKSISAKNGAAASQTQTTTQPAQTTTQYLTIKEWGVKMPLSSAISDAYYKTEGSNNGTDGLPNTAWLGLTSLNSTDCNISTTGPSAKATPLGDVVRVLPTDLEPIKGKPYSQLYPGVTIGKYFYGYVASATNTTCSSATTLQGIDSAFTAAVKDTVSAVAN
jgi:hypothetical protein